MLARYSARREVYIGGSSGIAEQQLPSSFNYVMYLQLELPRHNLLQRFIMTIIIIVHFYLHDEILNKMYNFKFLYFTCGRRQRHLVNSKPHLRHLTTHKKIVLNRKDRLSYRRCTTCATHNSINLTLCICIECLEGNSVR